MLKLMFLLAAVAHATPIQVPIKIVRVPFTGEHFMYNDQEEEKPLFKKLFDEGRVQFTRFLPLKVPEKSELDFASKARIGYDEYLIAFASKEALHEFARDTLKEVAPYNMPHETVPYALLTGIRDYAIKHKDRALMQILLDKTKSKKYEGSANESKAKIYAPLEQALK